MRPKEARTLREARNLYALTKARPTSSQKTEGDLESVSGGGFAPHRADCRHHSVFWEDLGRALLSGQGSRASLDYGLFGASMGAAVGSPWRPREARTLE